MLLLLKHIPTHFPARHSASPRPRCPGRRRRRAASMEPASQSPEEVYSVWALPPEPARERLRRLMAGLRAAHGGPAFEPHITVVGATRLRREAAVEMLRVAAAGVAPYKARFAGAACGGFFYQCVYLLVEPTPEVKYVAAAMWRWYWLAKSLQLKCCRMSGAKTVPLPSCRYSTNTIRWMPDLGSGLSYSTTS